MIKTFFTFEFSDEDADQITTLRFNLEADIAVYERFYQNYDAFEEKSMLMEVHGVHDCSAHSGDLEGFTSYEIAPGQEWSVMGEWRQWFAEQGFAVGEPYQVPYDEDDLIEDVTAEESNRRDAVWDQLDEIRGRVFANR